MEPPGHCKQFLPGLRVVDSQSDLGVGIGQRVAKGDAADDRVQPKIAPSARTVIVASSVPPAQVHCTFSVLSQHSGTSTVPSGGVMGSGTATSKVFS